VIVLNSILIALGIIFFIILLIFFIKKILPLLIIFALIFVLCFGLLSYYGVSIKDAWGYQQLASISDLVKGDFNYEKDKKKLIVTGDGYSMSVQKFDDGTEINGESSILNKQATEKLLGLFATSVEVFGNDDLKGAQFKDLATGDVIGDSTVSVVEALQDKESYDKILDSMNTTGNVLEAGKLKMYIKDDKLKLEKIK
jgi:hypothetical protein